MTNAHLTIQGMSCTHCVNAVTKALGSIDGVSSRAVRIGDADISYDPQRTTPDAIVAAVAEAGYTATVDTPAP